MCLEYEMSSTNTRSRGRPRLFDEDAVLEN